MRFARVFQFGLLMSLVAGFGVVAAAPVHAWGSASSAIRGTISRDGVPVSRSEVQVRAWPAQAFLESVPEGQGFELPIVFDGSFENSGGAFSAPVNLAALSDHYRDADGAVHLQVLVTDGVDQVAWNLSVVSTSSGDLRVATTDESAIAPILTFDLGSGSTVTDHNGKLAVPTAPRSEIFESEENPCGRTMPGDWHYARGEFFARILGTTDAPASIVQTYGSDHELGIGLDPIGSVGWRASGTSKVSFSASAYRSGFMGSSAAWNKVNYRDFITACVGEFRRPISVYALLTGFTPTGTPRWTACQAYPSGVYSKTRGRNTTWGGGMDIEVLKVSAQAGWNTEVRIGWNFRAPDYLCGSTSSGSVESPEAQSRPTRAS